MTVARYIALSLISRYHCLDPTNRDISGLHCITITAQAKIRLWHLSIGIHFNTPGSCVNFCKCYNWFQFISQCPRTGKYCTNSSCCCYLGWLTISLVYRHPCCYGIKTTCQFAPLALVYCCYRQVEVSNIRRTESQHLKDSRTVLRLFCRIPWSHTY